MSKTDLKLLASFPTAFYADAFLRLGLRGWTTGLRPVAPLGRSIAGPAVTARFLPSRGRSSSGLRLYDAIRRADPGDILVLQAPYNWVAIGDLLATYAQRAGLGGIVLDGYLRDTAAVAALGFPILCRGPGLDVTATVELADWGLAVDCGGAQVRPADLVVADDDGAIVIPAAEVEEVLTQVLEIAELESELSALVEAGAPPEELTPLLRRKGIVTDPLLP